jgi:hypothetical protein
MGKIRGVPVGQPVISHYLQLGRGKALQLTEGLLRSNSNPRRGSEDRRKFEHGESDPRASGETETTLSAQHSRRVLRGWQFEIFLERE